MLGNEHYSSTGCAGIHGHSMNTGRNKLRWNGWGWIAHRDSLNDREEVWPWLAAELRMPALLATPARSLDDINLPAPRLTASDIQQIGGIVGPDRLHGDSYERAFHALGRSYHDLIRLRAGTIDTPPDLVVYPRATEEVVSLLAFASESDIAVVPYGGGTSVVGGVTASAGSHRAVITLDLSGMSRLLAVDEASLVACAEGGIMGPALEKALQANQLTLGHFPQSFEFSTLGGWIAHRGSGQGSSLYGRVEDWLVSATLATPRGLLTTSAVPAASAGPDLNGIIIGSEGAFGVVTEANVRVHRAPSKRLYCGYLFHDFERGQDAVRKAVQEEIPATMLRLSDAEETRFYRAFASVGRAPGLTDRLANLYLGSRKFDAGACVLIAGFEGEADDVRRARNRFASIAQSTKSLSLGEGQGRRWLEGRFHGPYFRDPLMDRGVGVDTLETAARWSKLPGLYSAVRTALEKAIEATVPRSGARGIVMCHVSHSYRDGASLYFTAIFPRALGGEIEQWRTIKNAATDAILANGGALSHHHGVGEDHLAWMKQEKSEIGLEVLRAVKNTLDPKGVMNPGKLIPPK